MIIEAIIVAIGMIVAARTISGAIEDAACDLAEDFFTRWDALVYQDEED